jgi:hypothetical protein
LLYLCSWRLSFLLLFDLVNLISAEDAASLQAGLYTRLSYNSFHYRRGGTHEIRYFIIRRHVFVRGGGRRL